MQDASGEKPREPQGLLRQGMDPLAYAPPSLELRAVSGP